jgi:hypothetical protein
MVLSLNQYCLNARHCHWIIYWAWFIQVKRTFGRNKWFIWYQFTAVRLIIFFCNIKTFQKQIFIIIIFKLNWQEFLWNMVIKLSHPHKVRIWISDVIFRYLFLCWEVIVRFVDMGGIVDQDCLNFLVYTTSYWNQKQMLKVSD